MVRIAFCDLLSRFSMVVSKEVVPALLDQLTDDELKKEAKNDAISAILKACKCLVSKIPHQEDTLKDLEIFRLKMILRYICQHPLVNTKCTH